MNYISIIIAIIALLFSVFTYFAHDRKLKKQETILNEYQIRIMAHSEDDNKKAIIRAKIDKNGGGKATLFIYNCGKAKARNLAVNMSSEAAVGIIRPQLPQKYNELLPNAYREFKLFLCEGEDELTLNYVWDDDFKAGNEETQTVDL